MKYKVNDRVKIKSWDDMEREYGLDSFGDIVPLDGFSFSSEKEKCLNDRDSDRILTIKNICSNHYVMEKWKHGIGEIG